MATRIRTVDFLPEIFRTDTNKQFLGATLDQLTQNPKLKRLYGFEFCISDIWVCLEFRISNLEFNMVLYPQYPRYQSLPGNV